VTAIGGTHRSRRRLQLRLALVLALGTALVFAATAGFFSTWVASRLEDRSRQELSQRLGAVDELVERGGFEVARALERLERELLRSEAEPARKLVDGGAAAVPVAADLIGRAGLELLTILDADGVVVSCGHWPERAGLREPDLPVAPPEAFALRSIGWPSEERLLLLASREIRIGPRRFESVGGLSLQAILERRWLGGEAWLFDRSAPAQSSADPDAAMLGLRDAGPELLSTARSLYGRRLLTDGQGSPVGSIVVAVDRSELVASVAEMRRMLVIVGLFVTSLGAVGGVWIAGRLDRPVRQLVRAVDAIGAGDADYTFPRATRDEFEQLEQAFSRLQRSLQLQQRRSVAAERIAAWREVARHVAHEVKNPLAPIRLTVENLIRARRDDPALFDELFEEGATTILEEVDQLRQLVEEFSAFARLPAPKPRPVDLHRLIDGVADLYRSEPGLEIRTEYDRRLPAAEVDPDQLSRALKNIVGNAVEAMRELDPGEPRLLELRTRSEAGAFVIEVEDSGPGLSPEAQDRIFMPYFTTKGDGTGLGMAIAHRIVTEHGGNVSAENRDRSGARVSMRLPLVSRGPTENAAKAADEASR